MKPAVQLTPLFLGERYLVEQLLFVNSFYLHENPEAFIGALVPPDGEGLSALRRTLMDYVELRRWMRPEKIAKDKFGLRFTIRLDLTFNCHVNGLEHVSR